YRFIAPLLTVEAPSAEPSSAGNMPTAEPPGHSVRTSRARLVAGSVLAGLLIGGAALTTALVFDIGGARTWLRRQSNPPVQSLAVLPLDNLSRDSSLEYFADGMTEQLIATLAQLPSVRVISRTSAMQYKATRKPAAQIGREL